jgi:hypothetical protein
MPGDEKLVNRIRREQTELELQRLRDEVHAWCEFRTVQDQHHQYATQLHALQTLVDGALPGLESGLAAVDLTRAPGKVYNDCRRFELRLLCLRRLWLFYKDKFDQRDSPDEETRRALQAADEVLWSCYRQPFLEAEVQQIPLKQGPAPLPYFEPRYAPVAFPAREIGTALLGDVDSEFVAQLPQQLPLAVLALPAACVRSPWWLAYVAHEAGHHVQYDLADRFKLVTLFRDRLKAMVAQHGGEHGAEDAEQWGGWADEIFADIYSVMLLGPWAAAAMIELEQQPDASMFVRRKKFPANRYPAPFVRLQLLAEAVRQLQLAPGTALHAMPAPSAQPGDELTRDLALVPRAVALARTLPLPDLPEPVTLFDLCDVRSGDFEAGGTVERWCAALQASGQDLPHSNDLRGARLMTAAGLAAWSAFAAADNPQRAAQRRSLADRTTRSILLSHEPSKRADRAPGDDATALGAEFAQWLLASDTSRLEQLAGVP